MKLGLQNESDLSYEGARRFIYDELSQNVERKKGAKSEPLIGVACRRPI